jgi:tetratricopeptide (TPR) repeat protein
MILVEAGPNGGFEIDDAGGRLFQALRTWLDRRRALRELRVAEDGAGREFLKYFMEQIDAALKAFHRGDRDWALKTWRELNDRYPRLVMSSRTALNLLVDLGRHDEAEALILKARRRYPWHRAMLAAVFAHVPQSRGEYDEALRRCTVLRRKFPRVAEGYTIAAACLVSLGRPDEAEAILGKAARRFPHNFDIVVAYARHAVRRKDWPAALRRWEKVKRWSDNFLGPVGMAQSLREMGRFAEAREFATQTCEQFPNVPWAYAELAGIAEAEGDLEGTVRRWEIARESCPDFALAYTFGAAAARKVGREAEADKILGLAVIRMRFELSVHLEYARDAERRGDQAAAAERWALVRERFPDCTEAREKAAEAYITAERQGTC